MKVVFANPFLRRFKKLSENTKSRFEKQLTFLLRDIRHSSLHAKKYDENQDVWQARVDDYYRFYFQIKNDTCRILTIIKHLK